MKFHRLVLFPLLLLSACSPASTEPIANADPSTAEDQPSSGGGNATDDVDPNYVPANFGSIPPTDPEVDYGGRWDLSVPEQPRADWPGVRIRARFTGTSVAIGLQDGRSDYVAYVDDVETARIETTSSQDVYPIAEGLTDGPHEVEVIRITEEHSAPVVFRGFELDAEAHLLPLVLPTDRRIEFIGASWTLGYANESATRECTWAEVLETTNTDKAFGSIVARHFQADPSFVAWGGKGMVRNYNSSGQTDELAFPHYYPLTRASGTELWNHTQWSPNWIVIQLGGNDYSTQPTPEAESYRAAYHEFLDELFELHPDVRILLATTSSGQERLQKELILQEQIEEHGHAGQIFHMTLYDGLSNAGCHWHPTVADHEIIARRMIEVIEIEGAWRE